MHLRLPSLMGLTVLAAALSLPSAAAQQSLNISLMLSSGAQRQYFEAAAREFMARHAEVNVHIGVYPDQHYKDHLPQWLEEERYELMYWQGGRRLQELVDEQQAASINDIWDEQDWPEAFSEPVKNTLRFDGNYYALPYSYCPWGIYYNRELFRERELDPPETWDQLLELAEQFSDDSIRPFSAGTRGQWPAAGWFDLINLRLNGPDFHQQLLDGQIPYTDERVRAVFEHWQVLIERDYFSPMHEERSWRNALPPLYRQQAAMMLIGNFAAYAIPEPFRNKISAFSFPTIDEEVPRVELTPTDVFFIPSHAKDNPLAREFLRFLGEPQVQQSLNNESGMLPAHRGAVPGVGLLLEESQRIINRAESTFQYFDRDTRPPMAKEAIAVFQKFMTEPDIDQATQTLEQARQDAFEQ